MTDHIIYMDNAATTATRPEVLEAMLPYFTEHYGNPSSIHSVGRDARRAVEKARAQVAAALGAQPRQIQLQFLIESFVLSVLGGLIGLILGLAVSYYFSGYMDIPFRISSFAISLGLGFSAAVGVIFGWAPARKASRLDPIDALRSM